MKFETTNEVRKFVEAWQAAELDPAAVAQPGELLERERAIRKERTELVGDAKSARARILDRLLDGSISVAEAVVELQAIRALTHNTGGGFSVAASLLMDLGFRVTRQAATWLSEHAETLYRDHVVDPAARIRAEIEKLAPALEGVDTSDAAVNAGAKAAAAWTRAVSLEERRAALSRVAVILGRFGAPTDPAFPTAPVLRAIQQVNAAHLETTPA